MRELTNTELGQISGGSNAKDGRPSTYWGANGRVEGPILAPQPLPDGPPPKLDADDDI